MSKLNLTNQFVYPLFAYFVATALGDDWLFWCSNGYSSLSCPFLYHYIRGIVTKLDISIGGCLLYI